MIQITSRHQALWRKLPMLSRRYKLVRFHCESLGPSEDAAACENVQLIVLLEDEDGRTIERSKTILAYPRIMADPEQFPSLVASELRSMMHDGSRNEQRLV